MGFSCGIIGLPNVGKSTLFNALSRGSSPVENYPFTTIEPYRGVVQVPDFRLKELAGILQPEKVIPTTLEFVDIAGLVKDAHKGEGLGNQFLAHIREVDAIAHVVRLFENPDIPHHSGALNPVEDIEIIETELFLKDVDTISRHLEKVKKQSRSGKKELREEAEVLSSILANLNQGVPITEMTFTDDEKKYIDDLYLLTQKPTMFIGNISEEDLNASMPSEVIHKFTEYMERRENPYIVLCGKLEEELVQLDPEERRQFMEALNIKYLALYKVIEIGYRLLNLVTFFTMESNIVQAWTVPENSTVQQAGGVIHSDFYDKFIKAEIKRFEDLVEFRSDKVLREYGRIMIEGKNYIVKDGDIITFKIGR